MTRVSEEEPVELAMQGKTALITGASQGIGREVGSLVVSAHHDVSAAVRGAAVVCATPNPYASPRISCSTNSLASSQNKSRPG